MARTITAIKQQIIDVKNSLPSLSALNSPSQAAIWNLWAFIQAVCVNLFEQILDIYIVTVEGMIAQAGSGTVPWLRAQILKFQYSATNSQFVQLNTTTLLMSYPIIDKSLQILTRVSVIQLPNRVVNVKVAQSEPPAPLSGLQITALQSFLSQIEFAGTQILIINKAADSLIVGGIVFYTGQYASTISSDVITALNNYCTTLSSPSNFGSSVKATDIIKVILSVPGVTDFRPLETSVRPDGVVIGSRNKIFDLASGVDNLYFIPISGYIIPEATASYTFADTLTFTPTP